MRVRAGGQPAALPAAPATAAARAELSATARGLSLSATRRGVAVSKPARALAALASPAAAAAPERLRSLDGLRAIAVLAVLAYHLDLPGVALAGFLGVDVFFAISGFIITAGLLREWRSQGGIGLRAFYLRRIRRLMPSMLALLVVVTTLAPLLAPGTLPRLAADLPAALLYLSNWWQIGTQQSYFEFWGTPPLLQHLWSLAVEEQYYLLWPLLMLGLVKLFGPRRLGLASLGLALASTAWMAWLFLSVVSGRDPSRVYLGTDTHLMGLWFGSALACWFDPWRKAAANAGWSASARRADALAAAALTALLGMMLLLNRSDAFLYLGGIGVAALLSCALIWATAQPGSLGQRLLSSSFLQWAGTRSYALYLWHWPVFIWLAPLAESGFDALSLSLLRLLLAALCAELSYGLIELPFKHAPAALAATSAAAAARSSTPGRRGWSTPLRLGTAIGAFSSALLLLGPLPLAPANATEEYFARDLSLVTLPAPLRGRDDALRQAFSAGADGGRGWATALSSPALPRGFGLSPDLELGGVPTGGEFDAAWRGLTVIGDSVMLGARPALQRLWPGVRVDAEVGRQGSEGLRIIDALRGQGALGEAVVLHLGTNGFISRGYYRSMLGRLADRRVVVAVNVHAERQWSGPNNAMLASLAASAEFANLRVVDWSGLAASHPEYLVRDGVHLSESGVRALAAAIRRELGAEAPGGPSLQGGLARLRTPATSATSAAGSTEPSPGEEAALARGDGSAATARPETPPAHAPAPAPTEPRPVGEASTATPKSPAATPSASEGA